MEFWALSQPQPGTIRIAVGEAHGPHRCMINHEGYTQEQWNSGQSMTTQRWQHRVEFWAYPSEEPGTIRIAIGQAVRPHRCMLNHDGYTQEQWISGQSMTTHGWQHHMEFWAYPCNPESQSITLVPEAGWELE